jgi:hypothetical protein
MGLAFALPLLAFSQNAPKSEFPRMDKSPLDVSYYPADYPMLKNRNPDIAPLSARLLYSRPEANNRPIFGELIPYGKVWRVGANENTEVEFYKPVTINNKKVKEGKYSIFALVEKDYWEIIINSDLHSWGAFSYKPEHDVVRVKVPVQATDQHIENLCAYFKEENGQVTLNFAWEKTKVSLPIKF